MNEGIVLRARGLTMAYGLTPALRGIDLDVRRGEILAVTGPSGSGKSSLLLCLAGVLTPDAGTVTFGERLVSAENVALPLLLGGMKRAEAFDRAQSWLQRFGVADHADDRPGQMSGGQAQRVAVARAMVTEPAVLFADEPTGALDSIAAEQVMGAVAEAARETGTTVVLVTHEARVAAYGDRDVEVRDGQVSGGILASTGPRAMEHRP